jgi:microcystin-dependent protein
VTFYSPAPRNDPAGLTAAQVDERVREILNSSAASGSYAPRSVPWAAVSLPLVSVFPEAPGDRDEVNLLDDETGTVSRWIWLNSKNAWMEIRAPGDLPGIMGWTASSTAPTGWLTADGTAVSRTTYAGLFDAIGTTYGVGDGSTTFNLPNVRDRFPVGAGSTYALAATGGAATHTLTTAQIPGHTHSVPNHTHTYDFAATSFQAGATATNVVTGPNTGNAVDTRSSGSTTTGSAGSGSSHNNLPPYLALTPIIRT